MSKNRVFEAEALLVVDMQVGFVTGVDAVPQNRDLLEATAILIGLARAAGVLVIFLQNDGPVGAIDEPNQPGWSLYFAPQPEEIVIRKSEDDGFMGTNLNDCLTISGIRTLAMCGLLSEMCLATTARSAMTRGYTVILPHDGHATYDVPPGPGGSPGVPSQLAARAAEWSLGDRVVIPPSVRNVLFLKRSDSTPLIADE
ncbi:MAG: isochorismatase family protein [Planctomycetota bacterium]